MARQNVADRFHQLPSIQFEFLHAAFAVVSSANQAQIVYGVMFELRVFRKIDHEAQDLGVLGAHGLRMILSESPEKFTYA